MASFDFVEASAKGYAFIWHQRSYLSRVALPVFFVKVGCLLTVFVLGAEEQHLRQGLIAMPGFFAEALFVIGLIRYFLYNEPIFIWGKIIPPPKTDPPPTPYRGFMPRKSCIQGGIALYLLIRVIEAGILGWKLDHMALSANTPAETATLIENQLASSLTATIILFATLFIFTWAFRLFWLFIPITMGHSLSNFLKKIAGLRISINMIATWFTCSLPLTIAFAFYLEVFSGIVPKESAISILSNAILQTIVEIAVISIQVIAMTYGLRQALSEKNKND